MPVYGDLDEVAWIPGGGAAAGTITFVPAAPRVIVDDFLSEDWNWSSAPLYADNLAITAVYNPDLARVQLTGTGLEPFTRASIQRSVDGIVWTTVRGGVSLIVSAGVVTLDDYEFVSAIANYYRLVTLAPFGQTSTSTSITPRLDRIWIKSLTRPFLNRAVTVCGWTDIDRPDRGGDFEVVNRSASIGVTDIGGGQRFDLSVYAAGHADAQTFKYILASGDLLFVHTPANCEVPGGYFRPAGSNERRPHVRATSRVFTMPMVECIPPGPDVAGSTNTWAAVLALYPTWEALLAANPTWADLLARIAAPTEVIVP